jgi:two-component system sensor histidine kinase EvgS
LLKFPLLFRRFGGRRRNHGVLAVLDALPDGITLVDAQGRVQWLNTTAMHKTGWRQADIVGKSIVDIVHPDDAAFMQERFMAIAATPMSSDRMECRLRLPGNGYISLECTMRNLFGVEEIDAVMFCTRDISAQINWRRQLEAAREQAEKQASERGQFLAVLGHEIRTPLQALEAALRMQVDESTPPEEAQELRALSLRSAGSLLQILDDLLDLSRLNAKVAPVRSEPFDPLDVAREIAGIFDVQARAKGGSVRAVQEGRDVHLLGESARVRQILSNLVGNAVRHAGGGEIEIALRIQISSGRKATGHWEIRDRGPGMSGKEVASMFRIWHKGASSTGSGLGMAIVQGLVDAMGGSIDVSPRPGGGLSVHVQLPMDVAEQPPAPVVEARADASKVAGDGRPRVLVAEDDRTNQIVIRRQLENLGCRAVVVADGQLALDELRSSGFDIVLLDCQMPVLDGYGACREIRRLEKEKGSPRVPVLAVTAWAMQADRDLCMESGMDAVLTKPLRQAELASALSSWIGWGPGA